MKKKGFTLIELLVVLSIISIMLAIGLPRFNVVNKIKADTEIQTMANDINHAKMKAMTTGKDYIVTLYKDSYFIVSSLKKDDRIIERDLEYISIQTEIPIKITYKATGSVANAGTIKILSKYGDEDKIASLVVTVAGGYTRIDD